MNAEDLLRFRPKWHNSRFQLTCTRTWLLSLSLSLCVMSIVNAIIGWIFQSVQFHQTSKD